MGRIGLVVGSLALVEALDRGQYEDLEAVALRVLDDADLGSPDRPGVN